MSARQIPRLAIAVLERLVPRRGRAEAIGDLTEEFDAAWGRVGRLRASFWLWRQVASLAAAWTGQRLVVLLRSRIILWRDVLMVMRSLARRPIASAGAAAMLAVGLVAVALSAALSHVLLARPVSVVHGAAVQRLVAIEQAGQEQSRFSFAEWRRMESSMSGAANLTAVGLEPALVVAGPARRQTLAEIVSARYGEIIGMSVGLGRPLMAPDFVDGSPAVAVISQALWRELFAASPAAIGAPIAVNGRPFVVVGVARPGPPTTFWGASVDVWVPLAQGDAFLSAGWRTTIESRPLTVFALPLAETAVVTGQLRRAAEDLGADYPVRWRQRLLRLLPATALLGSQRTSALLLSRVLIGLAILILIVASANLGATMLAAAAAGRRALAIHVAIGAGPGVGPRRVLIEGALVGAGAAALAVPLYAVARVRLAEIALLPTLSFRIELPSAAALLWVIVPAGVAAGLLMAAGPAAWMVRQPDGMHALTGGRSTGDRGVARTRRLLVGAQMALCLVLLIGASLFTRSLDRLTHADLGFARDGLLAFDFDVEPADAVQRPPEAVAAEAVRRVRAMPGVTAAAMASRAPVDMSTPATRVSDPRVASATGLEATFITVTAGYFETAGVPLVLGRAFRDDETDGVAIVNETLARKLWPDSGALDRAIRLDANTMTLRIVGVARDAKYQSVSEAARPHVYLATSPRFGQALLVRTANDPRRALADVQRVLDELGVAGFFPRTADDHLAIQWLPTRAVSEVARWLSTLALAFCAAGLYGLVAWFAELRRREMAVRLALGATRFDIERLVVAHALAIAGPGLLAGLVLAAVAAAAARALLYGLGPLDLAAPAAGVAVLLVVVVAASWRPARAAARTDPAITLRT